MNQLKTAFLVVALTVLLVRVGDLWQGTGGMIVFLGIALVMNGVAYWFSDRIALSSAQAHEVTPAGADAFPPRRQARFAVRCAASSRLREPRPLAQRFRDRAQSVARRDLRERRAVAGPRRGGALRRARARVRPCAQSRHPHQLGRGGAGGGPLPQPPPGPAGAPCCGGAVAAATPPRARGGRPGGGGVSQLPPP